MELTGSSVWSQNLMIDKQANSDKIILDLCGGTGSWSKPYKDAGYTVYVITLPDYDVTKWMIVDDGKYIVFLGQNGAPDLNIEITKIYGILAAPVCTEFSFAKSNSKYPRNIERGMITVRACMEIIWQVQYNLPTPLAKRTNLAFWALENPFGLMRRYLGHPVLIFNPYDYGDPYQKKTCLSGFFNIPKKKPIELLPLEKALAYTNSVPLKNRTGNANNLGRAAMRSVTPPGFANAFFLANK